jgi:hypothetical protein
MKAISQLLRHGGLFYCTTPNFNSVMRYFLGADYNLIEYPEHLSYYTRATLNRLAAMHGLKNIRFLSTGISIARLKHSAAKIHDEGPIKRKEDEILRDSIENKWYLKATKNLINFLLNISNSGLTLKGYYEKPQA